MPSDVPSPPPLGLAALWLAAHAATAAAAFDVDERVTWRT